MIEEPKEPTILVPIDYSPQSMAAYDYSKILARATGSSLTLLYIIEEPGFFAKKFLGKEQRAEIIHQAEGKLKELIANDHDLNENQILTHPVIRKGNVYRKIINLAHDTKPKLIIMGRTDSSNFKKNLTGTNTQHIVSEAKTPVITIKGSHEITTDDHILLPLDLTHPVKKKIAKAIEMAQFLDARVSVLSVLQSNWLSKKIKFRKILEEIKRIFVKYQISCDTNLMTAKKEPQAQIINQYALDIKADLIMLMTHQEMNIHHYFIGSTAKKIIDESDLPVLSIIPDPELNLNIKHHLFKEIVDPLQVFGKLDK